MGDYKVYIHTNNINGMRYVGITQQYIKTRWQSGNGYRKQSHFWNAIKKYGWENFSHVVLYDGLTLEEAARMETELIAKYKTCDPHFGYNKSTGGDCGAKGVEKTEKQREAASRFLREKWKDAAYREAAIKRMAITCNTKEANEKRAKSQIGRRLSEKSKQKISDHKRGVKRGPFTREHIENMKLHHGGGAKKKKVVCVDTGVIYDSINDAARETGISKKGISGCCRGVTHYNTAGGYRWSFCNGS